MPQPISTANAAFNVVPVKRLNDKETESKSLISDFSGFTSSLSRHFFNLFYCSLVLGSHRMLPGHVLREVQIAIKIFDLQPVEFYKFMCLLCLNFYLEQWVLLASRIVF